MKKLVVLAGLILCLGHAYAGGILTNGNQSAQYVRMLSRNASTSIDAVYFNPAGLMKLDNGFHIAVQSQTLHQTRTVESGYPLLTSGHYEADLKVPVFPNAYGVYKTDNYAISFGYGPNSGGGSADYNTGLPSFEKSISQLVPGLAGLSKFGYNITGYKVDMNFKGESVFWGFQGGVSVKLNDQLSVYGGARYVPASNKYTGYLQNIQLYMQETQGNNHITGYSNAATFLTTKAVPAVQAVGAQLTAVAASVQPLITAGAGGYTLATIQGAGYISALSRTQLEGGLLSLGLTQTQINAMTLSQVQAAYTAGANTMASTATSLTNTAGLVQDKAVDVQQTGSGITPILGLNYSPNEDLNIGIKYELKTKLSLTNKTTTDGTGLFPDGKKTATDLPSILAAGINYKVTKAFLLSGSFTSYHDKGVNWGTNIYGQNRTLAGNTYDLAIGGQYQLIKWLALSAGYMHTEMGASTQFQSDFAYYNSGDTFAGGFEIKPTSRLTIDLGALATNYDNIKKPFTDAAVGSYTETYKKHNVGLAFGLAYHFGGN